MDQVDASIGRFARNAQGSVLSLGAAGLLAGATLAGGSVDMSHAFRAKSSLQAACDNAVLAARRAALSGGFDQRAQQMADRSFAATFDQERAGARGTAFLTMIVGNGERIVGSATTSPDTLAKKAIGMADFEISVSCSVPLDGPVSPGGGGHAAVDARGKAS